MPTLYQSVSTTRPFAPGAEAPTTTQSLGPYAPALRGIRQPGEHASSVGAPPPVRTACAARPFAIGRRQSVLLLVGPQKVANPPDGHFQIILARQGDDAEVVRPGPVERSALDDEDFLLQQQVQHHLLVVVDRVDLGVQL